MQLLPKPPEGGWQLNRSYCPGVNAWARESLLGAVLAPVLLFRHFIRDFVRTENLPQHFPHRAHVDRNCPVDGFVVDKITDQRLNVAVEDQANQLSVLVDGWRARIAADDVVGRDEIERRARIDCRLFLHPTWRQVVWELILEVRRPIVQTAERRERRDSLTVLQVTLHCAVRESQR